MACVNSFDFLTGSKSVNSYVSIHVYNEKF